MSALSARKSYQQSLMIRSAVWNVRTTAFKGRKIAGEVTSAALEYFVPRPRKSASFAVHCHCITSGAEITIAQRMLDIRRKFRSSFSEICSKNATFGSVGASADFRF